MKNLNEIVTQVKEYLESTGVERELIESELSDVQDILVLNLPDVCILKENRISRAGNQTHIHVTGQGMKFFFDNEVLDNNPLIYADDIKEDLILFKNNLIDLENKAASKKHFIKSSSLMDENNLINSYTVKKVGRIGSPSIQVQISKLRQDDKWFIHLRKCLFTNDVLIFIKTTRKDSIIVVAIPYIHIQNNPLNNTVILSKPHPKGEEALELEDVKKQQNRDLRPVGYESIAKFAPTDEDDSTTSMTDLTNSISQRKKRTERHNDIVKMIALDLEREGYSLYENPIDCLAILEGKPVLLFEVKTLDGTVSDEKKQVQKAFSQLFYYETFNTKQFNLKDINKIAVFENKITDEHIDFFKKNGIQVFWLSENRLNLTNKLNVSILN